MAFRNVPDKRFDIEILTIDGTLQWRGSDDPCIQLIIAYLFNNFIGQELFECKIDFGMLQNKIPEKHRDKVGCNCGDNPHPRSEEHTSELQSRGHLVCRLLLEKKNRNTY